MKQQPGARLDQPARWEPGIVIPYQADAHARGVHEGGVAIAERRRTIEAQLAARAWREHQRE